MAGEHVEFVVGDGEAGELGQVGDVGAADAAGTAGRVSRIGLRAGIGCIWHDPTVYGPLGSGTHRITATAPPWRAGNPGDTWVRQSDAVSYLLRLILPDQPGALGAVATALGTVGGDILSIDVIERSPGSATDDFVVELPPDKLADSLVSAAATVRGVQVESIRPYAGQIDPHRELALLEQLGRDPESSLAVLSDGVSRVFRAGWALVLDAPVAGHSRVLARGGAAPEIETLPTPWWPATPTRPLPIEGEWAPRDWVRLGTELAVAPLGDTALLIGRPALRWLPSEMVRLQHLAAIAATVGSMQAKA